MGRARPLVRDQRSAMSRSYWRIVEWVAGCSDRDVIEAVHRSFQARGFTPKGVRLRASMYRDGVSHEAESSAGPSR